MAGGESYVQTVLALRLPAIKRRGGWKRDETVQGYIEEAERFEDNVAKAIFKPGANSS